MRLLLLLLSICTSVTTFSVLRPLEKEEKDKLAQSLNITNVDERASRLERLGRRLDKKRLQGMRKMSRMQLVVEPKVEIDPSPDNSSDLFDLNVRNGIAPFLYQGDVHLTEEQLSQFEQMEEDAEDEENGEEGPSSSQRRKRQVSSVAKKWTGGTVYYYLDPSINARKTASISSALSFLSSQTCVRFVQSRTAANRVKVFNGGGCYSTVGMAGGEQTLSIGDGCEVMGIVAHEFTHALGAWHTQMRNDRDSYVTVNFGSISPSLQYNFDKLAANQVINYTPYEYGSFMHYGATAFASTANGISISPRDPDYLFTMGNRQISFYDVMMINKAYGCEAKCPSSSQCLNNGTPNPNNCQQCICPRGYTGARCDQKPSGCGSSVTATASWSTLEMSLGSQSTTVNDVYTTCTSWITAPPGAHLEIKVTAIGNPQCNYGCAYNGLEIKNKQDQRMVNPIVCCPASVNKVFTSNISPTPLIAFNRYYNSKYTIQYRSVGGSGSVTTTRPPPDGTTTRPAVTTGTTTQSSGGTGCKNTNSDATCASMKANGFCTVTPSNTFGLIKYNCAKACGLCGKAATPCQDTYASCSSIATGSFCSSDPYTAEYHCARSCGFCTKPN